MTDNSAPTRRLLNKSGVPFQLAVEDMSRRRLPIEAAQRGAARRDAKNESDVLNLCHY